jgi:hypothetical protein
MIEQHLQDAQAIISLALLVAVMALMLEIRS